MSAARSFDSHKYVKSFMKTGLSEPQAEAIVIALVESKDYDLSQLATKDQLELIRKDVEHLKNDIERLSNDIERLSNDVNQLRIDTKEQFEQFRVSIKEENKQEFSLMRSEMMLMFAQQNTKNRNWMLTLLIAIIGLFLTVFFRTH